MMSPSNPPVVLDERTDSWCDVKLIYVPAQSGFVAGSDSLKGHLQVVATNKIGDERSYVTYNGKLALELFHHPFAS